MMNPKQNAETPSATTALRNSPRTMNSTVHAVPKTPKLPKLPKNSPQRIELASVARRSIWVAALCAGPSHARASGIRSQPSSRLRTTV